MLKNYVHATTTSTGTGALTVAGAIAAGWRTPLAAFGAGAKALLTVRNRDDETEVEVAIYTVNADGTLSRAAADVRDGTNGAGSLVNFSAGTKDIFCDADAAALMSRVLARSAASTVSASDFNALINATTGTWVLSLPAAATVGDGWQVRVRNSGTGVITIDPSGTEQVNGATTLALAAGDSAVLTCTGSAWVAMTAAAPGPSATETALLFSLLQLGD